MVTSLEDKTPKELAETVSQLEKTRPKPEYGVTLNPLHWLANALNRPLIRTLDETCAHLRTRPPADDEIAHLAARDKSYIKEATSLQGRTADILRKGGNNIDSFVDTVTSRFQSGGRSGGGCG